MPAPQCTNTPPFFKSAFTNIYSLRWSGWTIKNMPECFLF